MKESKAEYKCANGHITRQWVGKKAPAHCAQWRLGNGCVSRPVLVPDLTVAEAPKKKRVVKKK